MVLIAGAEATVLRSWRTAIQANWKAQAFAACYAHLSSQPYPLDRHVDFLEALCSILLVGQLDSFGLTGNRACLALFDRLTVEPSHNRMQLLGRYYHLLQRRVHS